MYSPVSLWVLLPSLIGYQLVLYWMIRFVDRKPILRLTSIDVFFKNYCRIHMGCNVALKLVPVYRAIADRPIAIEWSTLYAILESLSASVSFNFWAAMAILRYLHIFHWAKVNAVRDEAMARTATSFVYLFTAIYLIGELTFIYLSQGTLIDKYYAFVFSDVNIVSEKTTVERPRIIGLKLVVSAVIVLPIYTKISWYKRRTPKPPLMRVSNLKDVSLADVDLNVPASEEAEASKSVISVRGLVVLVLLSAAFISIASLFKTDVMFYRVTSIVLRPMVGPSIMLLAIASQNADLRNYLIQRARKLFRRFEFPYLRLESFKTHKKIYPVMV